MMVLQMRRPKKPGMIHTETKKEVQEVVEVAVEAEAATKVVEVVLDPKLLMKIVKIVLMVNANHFTKRRQLKPKITKKQRE